MSNHTQDLRAYYCINKIDAMSSRLYSIIWNIPVASPKGIIILPLKGLFTYWFIHRCKRYGYKNNLQRYHLHACYGVSVGKWSYGFWDVIQQNPTGIATVGAFCSIAPNVQVTAQNHPIDAVTTSPITYAANRGFVKEDRVNFAGQEKNDRVIIGNDVWIGQNVTILPSVKIGDGAVIAAGAVVTKNVPDYSIVGGVPAKIIRYRFGDEVIDALQNAKWWEWKDSEIRNKIELLSNAAIFAQQNKKK